jgi:predicted phosphodiesterase
VCYGHSHAFSNKHEGPTVALNPGALSRTSYPSVAVVDLPSLEVTRVPVS